MIKKSDLFLALRSLFFILCATVYFSVVWLTPMAAFGAAILACAAFFGIILLQMGRHIELSKILQIQSAAALGFIYCGLFPALATKTLEFSDGPIWLIGLLVVVFIGDTFAFFSGRAFGKRTLLGTVSPKKTIEGAIGGLIGSVLIGTLCGSLYFPQLNPLSLALLALLTGVFAQTGDLFESLIKRVADVKDSGGIMPGHGGMLDRVDGVFFAAPVYFFIVSFLTAR